MAYGRICVVVEKTFFFIRTKEMSQVPKTPVPSVSNPNPPEEEEHTQMSMGEIALLVLFFALVAYLVYWEFSRRKPVASLRATISTPKKNV